MVTFNVFVKDKATLQGIGDARVVALGHDQRMTSIDPPVRQTSGDGGCNLYFQGPPFSPPMKVSLAIDAVGYAPWSNADQPVVLADGDVTTEVLLTPFL